VLIDRPDIAALLPHRGAMCLLDLVEEWDSLRIVCSTMTHHSAANPLRRQGGLGIMAGIEYAAQAMAVHAALKKSGAGRAARGYLAAVRAVSFYTERLDKRPGALTITADCQHREATRAVYEFALKSGESLLVEGRAIVVLDPP
jgi:predicted hotdog family 3-hydroxylacyl-ACP dehydratase